MRTTSRSPALDENLKVIKTWERAILRARSREQRFSNWIVAAAGSGTVLLFHVVWFISWVGLNVGLVPQITPFDPFPFPFLTMAVSLEAIFLTLFVLASQNRLAEEADKRAELDLQIDLLSEREMTAVLHLLEDLVTHFDVKTTMTSEELHDLMSKTDLQRLTRRMDDPDRKTVSRHGVLHTRKVRRPWL